MNQKIINAILLNILKIVTRYYSYVIRITFSTSIPVEVDEIIDISNNDGINNDIATYNSNNEKDY